MSLVAESAPANTMQLVRLFNARYSRLLVLTAALVYLLSQTADLQHTHDGRLNLQSDCHICLKLGSSDDAALLTVLLPVVTAPGSIQTEYSSTYHFLSVLTARARAPPVHTA